MDVIQATITPNVGTTQAGKLCRLNPEHANGVESLAAALTSSSSRVRGVAPASSSSKLYRPVIVQMPASCEQFVSKNTARFRLLLWYLTTFVYTFRHTPCLEVVSISLSTAFTFILLSAVSDTTCLFTFLEGTHLQFASGLHSSSTRSKLPVLLASNTQLV
ncbi:hypothetical protein Mapa_004694 [Marchantia paleacea]|nr:hypothetical protein Mapa_004694 [Marchantia paleacea]